LEIVSLKELVDEASIWKKKVALCTVGTCWMQQYICTKAVVEELRK
jgi:hypothetical protein